MLEDINPLIKDNLIQVHPLMELSIMNLDPLNQLVIEAIAMILMKKKGIVDKEEYLELSRR